MFPARVLAKNNIYQSFHVGDEITNDPTGFIYKLL
uniref:Uncharacterized protein n=1 Tax=Candidatus Methanogaster sp. ANME-2c ERB4 TaxID=2759911 RepID=A0A7G9YG36_9EURY|nr:hypothetical protein CLAIAILK_00031 [Methanosarcinales archaeon ANME-2c ERB4]